MIHYAKIDDYQIVYNRELKRFFICDRMGEKLVNDSFELASQAIAHSDSTKGLIK